MTKRIKTTGQKTRLVRPGAKRAHTMSGDKFAHALGAERLGVSAGLPSAYPELRRQLFAALKSRGGRPGLEGMERRQKIPMSEQNWQALEQIAQTIAHGDFAPTAGQVAARLLQDALVRIGRPATEAVLESRATRASEPRTTYGGMSLPSSVNDARRRHLELAEAMTERPAGRKELVIATMPVPIVNKGADAPTTSIAILGDAGAGKTTLAVSIAQAIAAELQGVALYLTTEIASTEIKYKVALLGLQAKVLAWKNRAAAVSGDLLGQHVALLDQASEDKPIRARALAAAWQLTEGASGNPPIRCVVIDAFPLPDSPSGDGREEIVALVQALEGRGISIVIVQEAAGVSDYVPFVTDIVFHLRFDEDPDTGERTRKTACPKSRYAQLPVT